MKKHMLGEDPLDTFKPHTLREKVIHAIPKVTLVETIRTYNIKSYLPGDMQAGLLATVMLVPQSLAYATLAGVPVEYGLYSSVLPLFAYAVFGTSKQLSVGPVAVVSLLVANSVGGLAGITKLFYS
jgi:MFS superfamily sulfate permease-like transporter